MKRPHPLHPLHAATAAALGLCLSLPVAAQDMTEGTTLGTRADKVSTEKGKVGMNMQAADRKFFEKATRANEKEVAAAGLARDRAQSQDVRDYASHLLRDHQDMLVKLDETAVALGVNNSRRYVAMAGWGSGMRDGTDPHPAQDNISASSAGPGSSNIDANSRTGGPGEDLTAAVGGDTGDDLANSTGSAVGQGGTAGRAASAAGGTSTGSTVTGRGTGTTATATTATGADTGYGESTTASTDINPGATGMTAQAIPDSARQDAAVRKLADAPADGFDRAFVDQMISDHKKNIEEFTRASRDESLSPQTRELASNALPKLQGHLAMAETLRGRLGSVERTN